MNYSVNIALGGLLLAGLAVLLRKKGFARPRLSPPATIALVFLASRLLLFLVALVAQASFDGALSVEMLRKALMGPDSDHYLRIAEFGYEPGTEYANFIVFYPLYPLLIHLLHYIIPNYTVCALLIGNLSTLGACFYLYGLVKANHSRMTALRSVKYLMIFPFSFFTLCVYTEGLFLLLSIGCLYYARMRRYRLCALFGALCAFTRNQGVLLLLPAAYEVIAQEIHPGVGPLRARLRALPRGVWLLLLIPLGLAAYLLLNLRLYGDAFAFMEFQRAAPWFQSFDLFPKNLEQHWRQGLQYPGLSNLIYFPQIALFFLGMWGIWYGERQGMRLSLLLYGFAYIIISYSAGWLISGGRYMLGCVPMFIALALRGRSSVWDTAWTLLCTVACIFMFILYIKGYAIM